MSLLIAVKSCRYDMDHGLHDLIRDTWGRDVPIDVTLKFFVGAAQGSGIDVPYKDVVYLDCKDDYDNLPAKTRKIAQWSVWEHDYTFLCDTDTFLVPKKLISLPYKQYDLSGRFGKEKPIGETFKYLDGRGILHHNCYPWPSGGLGYFVSKKAAEYIGSQEPNQWAEDMWVGRIIGEKATQGRFTIGDLEGLPGRVSWHYPAHLLGWNKPETLPKWMRGMYQRYR